VDLYLVRHARAFQKDPDRWPHDSRRPLTPEGEEEFRLAARGLARIVPRVDVILMLSLVATSSGLGRRPRSFPSWIPGLPPSHRRCSGPALGKPRRRRPHWR
jgi:hypothetical protein